MVDSWWLETKTKNLFQDFEIFWVCFPKRKNIITSIVFYINTRRRQTTRAGAYSISNLGSHDNCCFGSRWFGFLGSPCERDCCLGVPRENGGILNGDDLPRYKLLKKHQQKLAKTNKCRDNILSSGLNYGHGAWLMVLGSIEIQSDS